MRMIDAPLRKDPLKNRGWLRAFRKARLGWARLNFHKDYIKLWKHGERYNLVKAEEYFLEAKQILAEEGLTGSELERLVDNSLEEIASLYHRELVEETLKEVV